MLRTSQDYFVEYWDSSFSLILMYLIKLILISTLNFFNKIQIYLCEITKFYHKMNIKNKIEEKIVKNLALD